MMSCKHVMKEGLFEISSVPECPFCELDRLREENVELRRSWMDQRTRSERLRAENRALNEMLDYEKKVAAKTIKALMAKLALDPPKETEG